MNIDLPPGHAANTAFHSPPPAPHPPRSLSHGSLFLEHKQRRSDLDPVAVAESASVDGFSVDEGRFAKREVFQLEAAGDNVNRGVAAADCRVAEEVDLAVGAAADEGRAAVEDELLARDQSLRDAEPA